MKYLSASFLLLWISTFVTVSVQADQKAFDEIEPILMDYCYDCHGDGMDKGDFAMDEYENISDHLKNFDVWFETWEYQRVNSPVEQNIQSSKYGNLFILPAGDGTTTDTAWEIETHMTIKGQAKDHSALSRFVRRLSNQPEIHDIKILNTATAAHMNAVDFNIAITVITGDTNS